MSKKKKEIRDKGEVKSRLGAVVLTVALSLLPFASQAQCAMCRASLESSGNTVQAEAVNDGIVYLMIVPYVLVAIIGFAIYRMFKKKKAVH